MDFAEASPAVADDNPDRHRRSVAAHGRHIFALPPGNNSVADRFFAFSLNAGKAEVNKPEADVEVKAQRVNLTELCAQGALPGCIAVDDVGRTIMMTEFSLLFFSCRHRSNNLKS